MKSLFVLIMFALSSTALAGHPSEDPTVAQLRERFKHARTPEASDLRLGSMWTCANFEAFEGDFATESNRGLKLIEFDGMIKQSFIKKEDQANIPNYFTFQTQALMSVIRTPKNSNHYLYLGMRIDDNGNLLGEWSVRSSNKSQTKSEKISRIAAKSTTVDGAYVSSYELCVPY